MQSTLRELSKGKTYQEMATLVGLPYQMMRLLMIRCGVKRAERNGDIYKLRQRSATVKRYSTVDWNRTNVDIAREMGVSREYVRQMRRRFSKRALVECRGRRG